MLFFFKKNKGEKVVTGFLALRHSFVLMVRRNLIFAVSQNSHTV